MFTVKFTLFVSIFKLTTGVHLYWLRDRKLISILNLVPFQKSVNVLNDSLAVETSSPTVTTQKPTEVHATLIKSTSRFS
jgi:hypothetical protein